MKSRYYMINKLGMSWSRTHSRVCAHCLPIYMHSISILTYTRKADFNELSMSRSRTHARARAQSTYTQCLHSHIHEHTQHHSRFSIFFHPDVDTSERIWSFFPIWIWRGPRICSCWPSLRTYALNYLFFFFHFLSSISIGLHIVLPSITIDLLHSASDPLARGHIRGLRRAAL